MISKITKKQTEYSVKMVVSAKYSSDMEMKIGKVETDAIKC